MWVRNTADDRGNPTRAPWMEEYANSDTLPITWTANDKANVPDDLGEAMVERYDHIEPADTEEDSDE